MSDRVDALVVGGGISGLVAAWRLARRGERVVLLEPAGIGGMIRTRAEAGFLLEQGPNVLVEKPAISRLIDELNLRTEVVYPLTDRYRQFIWHEGRACQVPKSPLQFIRSSLLSIPEKLRVLKTLFFRGVLAPNSDSESVLTFFSRGLGEPLTRRIMDPVLKGIYGGDISRLSAPALFPRLWQAMKERQSLLAFMAARRRSGAVKPRIFVFRQGMSSLSRALVNACADHLEIVSQEARSVRIAPRSFSVTTDSGHSFQSGKLVLALPLRLSLPLLEVSDTGRQELQQILSLAQARRYAPLSVVHCASDHAPSFPDHSFGVLLPSGAHSGFLGAMFNSALFPHLAPQGKHLLTLCFGGIEAVGEPALLKPDDALVKSLCQHYLGVSGVTVLARHQWGQAIPQYEAEHRELESACRKLEESCPGLYLAGADRGGVGVSDRVGSVMELLNDEK